MKAKVIKTGEIVDVYHEPQHGQISNIYKESVLVNGRMWSEDELDFCIKVNEAPEKIYIDDFSSELSHDWHTEHSYEKDIEYVRKDAFIEKAMQFIKDNIEDDRYKSPDEESYRMGCGFDYFETNMFIEDFKKHMKE